ncbi:transmembrane emp24 domain-containing protein 5-like [Dendronephthya gigantea]|uniref:transmembrane emp24 domain-containing protein 5-like n=1 Tax=Dendronephthya gigantea TaxID=151771 RepID=UPI00106D1E47|nr:transmembrane emp24 domain-containing protein 5-like [Dendronephthya gigantea]
MYVIYLLLCFTVSISAMESGFTFLLGARQRECFFENLKANMSLDLEYQVIEGGDLDINFEVFDPNGKRLLYEEKTSDDSHELVITTPGIYSFCLDNSFSSITSKLVYLDLGIIDENEELGNGGAMDTVVNVYANIEGIRTKLDKASSYQGALRAKEARQRYFLESNNSRVMWVSCMASIIMISVGLVQVYFVRHLFDQRQKTRV